MSGEEIAAQVELMMEQPDRIQEEHDQYAEWNNNENSRVEILAISTPAISSNLVFYQWGCPDSLVATDLNEVYASR